MVRKRTRTSKTRRSSRKDYESEENESDSSLDFDSPTTSPAPKRYGLRQRKRPLFCEDFDYDEEDELNVEKHKSDDEEYNVEVDLDAVKETLQSKSIRNHTRGVNSESSVSICTIEPGLEEASIDDGLIDFEDVIRADVVVNKQRLDYDNIINKTEISVEEDQALKKHPVKEKGKRGRKPKSKIQPVELEKIHESQNSRTNCSSLEHSQIEDDTNVEVQLDPANFVQTEFEESESPPKTNGVLSENHVNKETDKSTENGISNNLLGSSRVDDIERYIPPELDEKEKEVILSNEYLLANSFDIGADEFLERQAQKKDEVEEEMDNIPVFNFDEDSNSSDDVVIIEKKPEIIVLDDD